MFPVSDVIPPRAAPVATLTLITVLAAVFVYELSLDRRTLQALFDAFGLTPGAVRWHAPVSSLFLHAGWVHLGVNVLYLWLFGENVEAASGRAAFVSLYFACGLVAAAVHLAAQPWSLVPMIGASGAVAGVMGAHLVLYPRSRILTVLALLHIDLIEIPAMLYLAMWFLLQFFSDAASLGGSSANGIRAFWATSAGFFAGMACGGISRLRGRYLRRRWEV